MDRERFRLTDEAHAEAIILNAVGHVQFDNLRAKAPENVDGRFERRHRLGVGGNITRVKAADEADAKALDAFGKIGAVVRHRDIGAGGITRIMPGDRLHGDCGVPHIARQRAGGIEGEAVGKDPGAAQPSIGWFEAE